MNRNQCLHHPPPPSPLLIIAVEVVCRHIDDQQDKLKLESTTIWEIRLISPRPWTSPSPLAKKKVKLGQSCIRPGGNMCSGLERGDFSTSVNPGVTSSEPVPGPRPSELVIAAGFFREKGEQVETDSDFHWKLSLGSAWTRGGCPLNLFSLDSSLKPLRCHL